MQPQAHHGVRTGFAYLDEPREHGHVLAMAHRGGAAHPDLVGLENTMRAFRHAVDLGYRYLETDVHATRDGELVAFHDSVLDRVTDRVGILAELLHADLAAVLIGGSEPIPRFADLLEEFPQARFNVDLKSPGTVEPMARLVEERGLHDRVCVGSFTERSLRRFRRLVRRPVATSCGVPSAVVMRYAPAGRRLERLVKDPGAAYQVPVRHRGLPVTTPGFVRRAHVSGRHVHVWTLDERPVIERVLDLGVDGIITDRTDVLREVLQARGLWHG